jgi:hypothetical protein
MTSSSRVRAAPAQEREGRSGAAIPANARKLDGVVHRYLAEFCVRYHPGVCAQAKDRCVLIGPQNTAVKTTLGPLLNGFVNYEYWQPVPKMTFPGVQQLLNTYQARANDAKVDPFGHYMAPLAYAQMQVVSNVPALPPGALSPVGPARW